MTKITEIFSNWFHNANVERMIVIGISVLIILIFSHVLKKIISKHLSDSDNKYRSRKVVTIFGYLCILLVILFVYNDKLGNIGIALGLAGAGIAFALQEVIISIAGWMHILMSDSIKIGQRIKIGELKGDIIDIGVLKTTIMEIGDWVNGDLYNGRITSISNSFVFKEPIQNYSADYPFLWDEITIPIRTQSDFKLARKVFIEVALDVCGAYAEKSMDIWEKMTDKFRVEHAEVNPLVTLKFDENWITFTIRYVVEFKKRRTTKDLLFTKLLEEINKYEDIIMIATSTIEVTNIQQHKDKPH